ncbi:MAG: galactose mutarotase [Novosphingobium sp.]|nr:galactose mutarotase [Novosphingobium sp.]
MIATAALDLPGFGQVTRWDMRNAGGTAVSVMSFGATLLEVQTRDRNGNFANIAPGCIRAANYVAGRHFLGPVVGRYANRIKDGRFAVDGQQFELAVNDGANALHGGPEGFDRRVWEGAEVETELGRGIRLTLTSRDGDQGFPGTLQAAITYVLSEDNRLVTELTARSDKPTPLNLSLHGYWNLAGTASPDDLYRHDLQLLAGRYLPVDRAGIPTGELRAVAGTAFDLRHSQNLGECLRVLAQDPATAEGFDHCWALDGAGLRQAALLHDPRSGRELRVETDQSGIQVYTANHFDSDIMRRLGENHTRHCAVALETQGYPDAPNQSAFPDTILRPGQVWKSRTIYSFTVR